MCHSSCWAWDGFKKPRADGMGLGSVCVCVCVCTTESPLSTRCLFASVLEQSRS